MSKEWTTFSRKHYNALAAILHSVRPEDGQDERMAQWEKVVLELALAFKDDNPRFLPKYFAEACTGKRKV